jgi:integrase
MGAFDYPEVKPVPDEVIDQTLPFMPPMIRDMVELQRLAGARPGEICMLTAGDINSTEEVWGATLSEHKTAYAGCTREVLLGPNAQAILRRYLPRASTAAIFSPREAEKARQKARRKARKTKLYPSHVRHMKNKRKAKPKRSAGEFFTEAAYRRAIQRACKKAGIEKWCPNQIRHTSATEYKNRFGWEAARVVLGQKSINTTAIYAERDRMGAMAAVKEIG